MGAEGFSARPDHSPKLARIEMFGAITVTTAEGRLGSRDFGGLKPKQVLELLLIDRGHRVSKDKLADSIWGESLPRNVNATLETYVSVLRAKLDPHHRSSESILVTEPGAYRLDRSQVEVDVDRFDSLVADARRSEGSLARTYLEAALGLVQGDVLDDEPYSPWTESIREQYRRRHVEILLELSEICVLDYDFKAAVSYAETALEVDPFQERAYQLLMTCFYALGDRRDAIAAFDRCRGYLEEELGIEPLKETNEVLSGIRKQTDISTLIGSLVSGAA